jgi:hypothetical protein
VGARRAVIILILAVSAVVMAFGSAMLAVKSQDPKPVTGQLIVYGPSS